MPDETINPSRRPTADGPRVDEPPGPAFGGTVAAPHGPPVVGAGSHPPVVGLIADRYEVGEVLGEGGMGTVYRAEQVHPVKRPVAVKLIRWGTDSARVLARFEAERQALAVMDHPGIAKVYDAGTTPGGQPFFVMELVTGPPLTNYCDERRMPVSERLRLFVDICHAVQHAHQKGVIHRDLKSGNILVNETDGRPTPKVIDFGLAKALSSGVLPELTLDAPLSVQGTPLYMAPEQADLQCTDIDTRADVYALGAILYELLTGTTPIRREAAASTRVDELLRLIRESEPPGPSSRAREGPGASERAVNRQSSPEKLAHLIRGDLDGIVATALAKDRDRRYESATDFARDVERFLAHEPVLARPPSAGYLVRKFVRRHRFPVAAAACVVLALVAGVVGTAVGLVEADAARREEAGQRELAEERRGAAERAEAKALAEADRANKEADAAGQVSAFLIGLFEPRDRVGFGAANFGFRDLKGGEALRARDLLDRGIERLKSDRGLKEQPLLRARLLHEVAGLSLSVGQVESGKALVEESLGLRRRALPPGHPDVLKSLRLLAQLELLDGDYRRCVDRHREVIALLGAAPDPEGVELAETEASLAVALMFVDRGESTRLLGHALEVYRKRLGRFDSATLTTGCVLLFVTPDPARALALAVEVQGDLATGQSHPELAELLRLGIAAARAAGGDPKIAASRAVLAHLVVVFGDGHFMTFYAKARLAGMLADQYDNRSRLEEAVALYQELVTAGPKWERADAWHYLSQCQKRLNRRDDAEASLTAAVAAYRGQCDELSAGKLPGALRALAVLYDESGKAEKVAGVEGLLTAAVDASRANPLTRPGQLGGALVDLGRFRVSRNPSAPTAPLFKEAVGLFNSSGKAGLQYLEALAFYDFALRRAGMSAEAERVRTELVSHAARYTGVANPSAARIRQLLQGRTPPWRPGGAKP